MWSASAFTFKLVRYLKIYLQNRNWEWWHCRATSLLTFSATRVVLSNLVAPRVVTAAIRQTVSGLPLLPATETPLPLGFRSRFVPLGAREGLARLVTRDAPSFTNGFLDASPPSVVGRNLAF